MLSEKLHDLRMRALSRTDGYTKDPRREDVQCAIDFLRENPDAWGHGAYYLTGEDARVDKSTNSLVYAEMSQDKICRVCALGALILCAGPGVFEKLHRHLLVSVWRDNDNHGREAGIEALEVLRDSMPS